MKPDFQPTEQLPRDEDTTSPAARWMVRAVRSLASRLGLRAGAGFAREAGGCIDAATALYNKEGLVAFGDKLLAQCEARHRVLSVAVFDFPDLVEVRSIYGTRIARGLTGVIVGKLLSIAGERGFAARTGLTEFSVVMPGQGRDKALAAIQRVLGRPTRIEFEAGDNEIVLVPGFALETSGPDISSVEELYREVRTSIDEFQRGEQRRHEHLQRSHERHSRPMSLTTLADRHPVARRVMRVEISPTMPAPIGAMHA